MSQIRVDSHHVMGNSVRMLAPPLYLKYNHLDGVNTNISVGNTVTQGAYIGITGSTGNAAVDGVIKHVHIQAKDANGQRTDPKPYFSSQFNINTGTASNPCN